MAPELYDEKYDEKVDIYAFGMCMLEIFTKEVPYAECSNPAQIYKKVTNQIEPESLSRIQSQVARDFILLCINTDPSKRPTATELLSHSFLSANADDAETDIVVSPRVLVLPAISEGSSKSIASHTRDVSDDNTNRLSATAQKVVSVVSKNASPSSSQVEKKDNLSVSSITNDTYHGMQNTEVNMKPVQVLMGRDEEGHLERKEIPENTTVLPPPQTKTYSSSQYIVAAECMDEVVVDNEMKFIISIPIQNETQHVQFDFHLVEDDPVQVAREMVTELQIPEQAILEISETISGLARDARVSQGKPNLHQQRQLQENEDTAGGESSVHEVPRSTSLSHLAGSPKESLQKSTSTIISEEKVESVSDSQSIDAEKIIDMDKAAIDELRKLGVEYRKCLERATKAYDTRMENMKRSKEEKQAQHLKLLEKHDREMDEFDKRLKQAELDQSKRLDKLDRDWNIQKKDFIEAKRLESLARKDVVSEETSPAPISVQAYPKVDGPKSSVSLLSMASASGGKAKSEVDLEALDRNDT